MDIIQVTSPRYKYKVLSNRGQVGYQGNNQDHALEVCINLNAEYQNTDVFFSVVEITPFRLLMPLHEAEKLQSFPYEIVYGDKAAWYMTRKEYQRQLNSPNTRWLILNHVADFDDVWYETFNS
jgi:hypothetical protein